ncbi:8-oxo-dGTP diphosphatase [Lachnoclostridium phytofermentans]|uniref:NUDIX hydrolase n=1 Tax=Lachnoclostridium phytofermentans (strain ATCC 700394 / DSM 18823 / ISDg) TaxID=357809 RepID=A9KR43_LACP7|nr:8-oxo-dGTP diphosphatase [Lachnoclostridium phytofermentans]ABX40511.1 NUDIX hydrolase [Lachnoclostridium phytofermentans ISDg]
MSRSEKAVFTNLCMITNGDEILVQERKNRDWPGVTFPGGHVEENESFVKSVIREVKEETGLSIKNPILCGIKQFQTRKKERYVVLFYKTDQFEGKLTSSDEGEVFFIPRTDLNKYVLAEDFDLMLKVFESEDLSECIYQKSGDEWVLELL